MDPAQTYDHVAYPAFPYFDTHPDRLAVMGILHGLRPAAVEKCRVLEVGCNEGANLIPMAYAIPGGEFVGFDYAETPVLRAQQRMEELGLRNIRVFQADILEASQELGEFDYIIAHGIYSWVPEPVRDALLGLCRKHLAPNGIAYINYNALPGGHVRNMMAEILRERCSGANNSLAGIAGGIEFLQPFLELLSPSDPLTPLMEREAKLLMRRDPHNIYHDELADEQAPILFSSFMAHARKHELHYVCESAPMPPGDPCYQPKAMALAKQFGKGDAIAEEQILDFLRMRRYRETLLCHATADTSSGIQMSAFRQLKLSSPAESSEGSSPGKRAFTVPGGARLETDEAQPIAVLEGLTRVWPQAVPFAEMEGLLERQGVPPDESFLTLIMSFVAARMIQLHMWDAPVSKGIAERPRASESGRQEAAAGHPFVTTLHHRTLTMGDAMVPHFLALLDGSKDRATLLAKLKQDFPEMADEAIVNGIDMSLNLLHRAGMLVAEDFA